MIEIKNKKLIITLDGEWAERHAADNVTPARAIAEHLNKYNLISVEQTRPDKVTVIYSMQNADYGGLKGVVTRLIKSLYPDDDPKKVLSFTSGTAD